MRRRLLLGFVLFAFIATSLLIVPLGITFATHESASTLSVLKRDTGALSTLLSDALAHNEISRATKLADTYAKQTSRQVLVADDAGVIIATNPSQAHDDKLLARAELAESHAVSGQTTGSNVESAQFYVAQAMPHATDLTHNIIHPVLLLTNSVDVNNSQIHRKWTELIYYGLFMLAIACLFAFLVSGSMVRPLRRIAFAIEAIGGGNLDVRAPTDQGPRELRLLSEAINSTATRLINLLEVQRAFVADASHQLRTPLTALQLQLENLGHSNNRPETSELANVLAEVARLNRLVDSLLTLARNESQTPELVHVPIDELSRERVDIWSALATERGLELTSDVNAGTLALAIPDSIEQILDNLLSNAFDATPVGGKIRVWSQISEGVIELHISDNGLGLSSNERELAPRRFWRGRNSDSDGTGLGLSIVDQLARLSGGSFELHEVSPHGIDAVVFLPDAKAK